MHYLIMIYIACIPIYSYYNITTPACGRAVARLYSCSYQYTIHIHDTSYTLHALMAHGTAGRPRSHCQLPGGGRLSEAATAAATTTPRPALCPPAAAAPM